MEASTLTRTLLFDTYGDMLTAKQRLCCDLRYNQDLSLGEIAELEGISREAVRDNLARSEAQLLDMEEKIGAVRRLRLRESAGEALKAALREAEALGPAAEKLTGHIKKALECMEE